MYWKNLAMAASTETNTFVEIMSETVSKLLGLFQDRIASLIILRARFGVSRLH